MDKRKELLRFIVNVGFDKIFDKTAVYDGIFSLILMVRKKCSERTGENVSENFYLIRQFRQNRLPQSKLNSWYYL